MLSCAWQTKPITARPGTEGTCRVNHRAALCRRCRIQTGVDSREVGDGCAFLTPPFRRVAATAQGHDAVDCLLVIRAADGIWFCRGSKFRPQLQVARGPLNACRFWVERTAMHTLARVAHLRGRVCVAGWVDFATDSIRGFFLRSRPPGSHGAKPDAATLFDSLHVAMRWPESWSQEVGWPRQAIRLRRVSSDACDGACRRMRARLETRAPSRPRQPFADRKNRPPADRQTRSNFQQDGKAPLLVGCQCCDPIGAHSVSKFSHAAVSSSQPLR